LAWWQSTTQFDWNQLNRKVIQMAREAFNNESPIPRQIGHDELLNE
jgi:hypothetical protein